METIFDHSVTADEFKSLFGEADRKSFQENYSDRSADEAYFDLHRLFMIRHNAEKANDYLDKIVNDRLRLAAVQLHDFVH